MLARFQQSIRTLSCHNTELLLGVKFMKNDFNWPVTFCPARCIRIVTKKPANYCLSKRVIDRAVTVYRASKLAPNQSVNIYTATTKLHPHHLIPPQGAGSVVSVRNDRFFQQFRSGPLQKLPMHMFAVLQQPGGDKVGRDNKTDCHVPKL